jgi:hypothetical protein
MSDPEVQEQPESEPELAQPEEPAIPAPEPQYYQQATPGAQYTPQPTYAPQYYQATPGAQYAPQPTYAPQYVQPVAPAPPAPLYALSGGMKAAFFFIGYLVGIAGMLIGYVYGRDKYEQVKKDAMKFTVIGFCVSIGIGILFCILYFAFIIAVVGSVSSSYY